MGKDKKISDEAVEKPAEEAAEEMSAFIKETGNIDAGLVYAVILAMSAKLTAIFNPDDVVTAFEMLAKQLRVLMDEVDKADEAH